MNSASRGLRPTVGLRRPKSVPCVGGGRRLVGGGRRLARGALRGRFQSAQKPSANGRPVRRMNSASRGLRPTVGLRRPKNIICVGGGRRLARSALRGRFQSAQKPSADGRPAPTGRGFFASVEADAWRAAPLKADFNRHKSLRPTVGLRRPGRCLLRRRRPTLGAERLGRPISIGGRGLRPTVGLRRPKRISFASAEADAWRGAPGKADFNRRGGLRPTVGLCRPGGGFASAGADAWHVAP